MNITISDRMALRRRDADVIRLELVGSPSTTLSTLLGGLVLYGFALLAYYLAAWYLGWAARGLPVAFLVGAMLCYWVYAIFRKASGRGALREALEFRDERVLALRPRLSGQPDWETVPRVRLARLHVLVVGQRHRWVRQRDDEVVFTYTLPQNLPSAAFLEDVFTRLGLVATYSPFAGDGVPDVYTLADPTALTREAELEAAALRKASPNVFTIQESSSNHMLPPLPSPTDRLALLNPAHDLVREDGAQQQLVQSESPPKSNSPIVERVSPPLLPSLLNRDYHYFRLISNGGWLTIKPRYRTVPATGNHSAFQIHIDKRKLRYRLHFFIRPEVAFADILTFTSASKNPAPGYYEREQLSSSIDFLPRKGNRYNMIVAIPAPFRLATIKDAATIKEEAQRLCAALNALLAEEAQSM